MKLLLKLIGLVALSIYVGIASYDIINVLLVPRPTRAAPVPMAATSPCPLSPSCSRDGDWCEKDDIRVDGAGGGDSEVVKGGKRPMILGMVTNNIDLARVGRFLGSCRKFIPEESEIHFMTDAQSTGDRAALYKSMRVTEYVFKKGAAETGGILPIIGRWPMMRDYLKQLPNSTYSKIMFADIRDAVCQSDPFARMTGFPGAEEALYVFAEAAPTKRGQDGTIMQEGKNRQWVNKCYGTEGSKVMKGIVSCAGITVGGFEAGYKYIDLLSTHILRRLGCNDQGVHNYLVYSGELSDAVHPAELRVESNENGWVLTVQNMIGTTMLRDKIGQVLNRNGVPYSILHQYDRSRVKLEGQFRDMYPLLSTQDMRTSL